MPEAPEAQSILTERTWSVTCVRNFFYAGVWRQVNDVITVPIHVARSMIEAGNAIANPDWPRHRTDHPLALQNVVQVSSGVAGVGSINGIEGDIQILAGPHITVTSLGQNITIGGIVPNAGQISLSPSVSSWTTVQQAVTALAARPPGVWQQAVSPAGTIYYSAGKVGIGTSSPVDSLEVASGSLRVSATDNISQGRGIDIWYDPSNSWGGMSSQNFTAGGAWEPISIDGSVVALQVDNLGGQVGIGTRTPSATLTVVGTYHGPAAHVSNTAPATPQTGQLWWDTTNLRLLIWTGFWVQVG